MERGGGCISDDLALEGGSSVPRVKWGDETPDYWPDAGQGVCGDCHAGAGQYHHLGCDIEQCGRCREQLITCDCPYDEADE
jgi:hypothetical protein